MRSQPTSRTRGTSKVMVVADDKMLKYHGASLEPYVLTLMSMVSGGNESN